MLMTSSLLDGFWTYIQTRQIFLLKLLWVESSESARVLGFGYRSRSPMAAPQKPFRAEYAKSNRSTCKTCQSIITKDSFRIAKVIPAVQFDGFMPVSSTYHLRYNVVLFLCVYVHTHTHIRIFVYVCVHVYIYVRMYVHACLCNCGSQVGIYS